MSVSIEQIKELRDATGVSMTACKVALEEANGDYDGAVDLLRKKGVSKAADRAERTTSDGAIVVKSDGSKTVMVSLLCETDFVAISDDFSTLGDVVAGKFLSGEVSSAGDEIAEVNDAVLKLGENIRVGDVRVYEGATVGSYVHSNKKIGVLVDLEGGSQELGADIAMHVAAMSPKVLSPDEVSEDLVAKEKEIWTEQLAAEGKPAEIVEKIMIGKEKKFREESALVKQQFVKDPEKTIEQLLAEAGASVKDFIRFAL